MAGVAIASVITVYAMRVRRRKQQVAPLPLTQKGATQWLNSHTDDFDALDAPGTKAGAKQHMK